MGTVIRFPSPKPPTEPDLPLFDGDVPAQCLATFRMLARDIESGVRVPENMFLVYGSHTPKAKGRSPSSRDEGRMTWSYLALELAPEELAAAVKRVVKDLKKNPNPQPPDCA